MDSLTKTLNYNSKEPGSESQRRLLPKMRNEPAQNNEDKESDDDIEVTSSKDKRRNEPDRNGRWLKGEHELFIQGCLAYGNNWKKVKQIVKTRTSAQIRSHAQKYLIKLTKKHNDYLKSIKHEKTNVKFQGKLSLNGISPSHVFEKVDLGI